MARIFRKTQKIFARNASNNGVFGSAADNTKILSSDLETIQSKPAYALGWLEAVLGIKKFPALEEFQALHYMTTTQISYLFQEGIPEYDSGTTYYQKSIVRKSGTYELYGSKTDDNFGNALTDADEWEFLTDLSATIGNATESARGIIELATTAEVSAGTDDERAITPAKLLPWRLLTGMGIDWFFSDLPAGYIWADGKTIGNALSNATNRANADTLALFTKYWNDPAYNYVGSNSPLEAGQVFTSAGAAVAKGASAAADFAANRAIKVIDKRGRASVGKDNMGGVPAGRLSGQEGGVNGLVLGAAGGAETHSLVTNEGPEHQHVTPWRATSALSAGGPNYSVGVNDIGQNPSTSFPNGPTYTGESGEGSPHNNVQPSIVCNYIQKL